MYIIYFPFQMNPKYALDNIGSPIYQRSNDINITLQETIREERIYALYFDGFKTFEAAEGYLCKLKKVFLWMGIECQLPLRVFPQDMNSKYSSGMGYSYTLTNPNFLRELIPDTDAPRVYNVIQPAILQKDEEPLFSHGGFSTLNPFAGQKFLQKLSEGITLSAHFNICQTLETALELYNFNFYEVSVRAKFLNLISILEILSNEPFSYIEELSKKKTDFVKDKIAELDKQVEKVIKDVEFDNNLSLRETVLRELKSLKSGIGNLKNLSASDKMRNFLFSIISTLHVQDIQRITDAFNSSGINILPNSNEIANGFKAIYGKRSSLVHGNSSKEDLAKFEYILRILVEAVLKQMILLSAK